MLQNTAIAEKTKQEVSYKFNRKKGATVYNVAVHFNKASRENINDKIKRLIRNDIQAASR